jgi:hypothetical protein
MEKYVLLGEIMTLVKAVQNHLREGKRMMDGDVLDSLLDHADFERERESIVGVIYNHLDYPRLDTYQLAVEVPSKTYEKKLLEHDEKGMDDVLCTYWMLALGAAKSEAAHERIVPYTKTELFHTAFIALAQIDFAKAMPLFKEYLHAHAQDYLPENKATRNCSGYNTLLGIFHLYPGTPQHMLQSFSFQDILPERFLKDACSEYIKR